MLSLDMQFEQPLLHFLATFCTLVDLLWTVFKMHVDVPFFYYLATVQRAWYFEFVDDLVETHVRLESSWKLYLALWTSFWLVLKLVKAILADNTTTLLAVEWPVWKLKADNAL